MGGLRVVRPLAEMLVLCRYRALTLLFRNWVAELACRLKPQIYGVAAVLKCGLLGMAVGRAPGKLGGLGDIYAVVVSPKDNNLAFVR